MSFTDSKPFVVSSKDLIAPWGGYRDGRKFRCYLCGHKFKEGDIARWIYNHKGPYGNIFTCDKCDGPDILDRWKIHYEEGKEKYWWLHETINSWAEEANKIY